MACQKRHIGYLLTALGIAIAPQIVFLPKWIVLWVAVMWGFALWAEKKSKTLPGKYSRAVLAALGVSGVIFTTRGAIDGSAYMGLLAIMSGLKVLEIKNRRDRMITVFLAYFLVVASLFQSESLTMTLYMLFSVAVSTAVLIHVNHPGGDFRAQMRISLGIMLRAAPITILLFIAFPRIEGGFWGFAGSRLSVAGFNERMYPGSVSSMVKNSEAAFRVRFENETPKRDLLYWRGVVLWAFDGSVWTRGAEIKSTMSQLKGASLVKYTLMLEPHRKKMLFTLDMPVQGPSATMISQEGVLFSRKRIKRKHRYQAASFLDYTMGDEKPPGKRALEIPRMGNPRARQLAGKWAENLQDKKQIVEAGLKFFRENDFLYTLNPPVLSKDGIDQFLFDSKKGYCEHFASSFAFLMRSAGVPARVVGGYQGGKINPYGNYLIVRQSDAHAWVEVWLSGNGWVRVDPTAESAPERISDGVQEALYYDEIPEFLSLKKLGPFAGFWKNAQFSWDAVNSLWDVWFVGYSHLEQRDFLSWFATKTVAWGATEKVFSVLLCLIIPCTLIWARRVFTRFSEKTDPAAAVYERFCGRLEALGIARKPGQGPLDFAGIVASERADLAESVKKITDVYVRLRYAPLTDAVREKELKKFKSYVGKFNRILGDADSTST